MFKVGDKWETVAGRVVKIVNINEDPGFKFPMEILDVETEVVDIYTRNGTMWQNSKSEDDLFKKLEVFNHNGEEYKVGDMVTVNGAEQPHFTDGKEYKIVELRGKTIEIEDDCNTCLLHNSLKFLGKKDTAVTMPSVEQEDETMNRQEQRTIKLPDVEHYNKGLVQPIHLINSQNLNFNMGNVVKYACRDKGQDLEDLQKIIDYANFEIQRLSEL